MGAPDALNRTHAEPRRLRHQDAGPVGRFPGRLSERQRNDTLGGLGAKRLDARGARLAAEQPVEPLLDKPFLPPPYARLGLAGLPHDLVRADAIGGQQDDFGSPDVLLRRIAVKHQGLEPMNIGGRNGEGLSCAHRADSHIANLPGIPIGTQMSGSIH